MEIFGGNIPAAVQYLLAFVIILALLAGLAAILRRISAGATRIRFSATSARHRQQRLGVIDAVDIDAHRQLLLLRRDNVEHLVMIGGPNDLLVESGIGRQPYRAMVPVLPEQHVPSEVAPQRTEPAPVIKTAQREKPDATVPKIQPVPVPVMSATVMPGPIVPRSTVGQRSMATPVSPAMPSLTATHAGDIVSTPVPPAQPAKAMPQVAPDMRVQTEAVPPSSGMARHLEEALKRPHGAVRPAPVTGIKLDEPAVSPIEVSVKPELEKAAPASFIAPAPAAPIIPPRQVPTPGLLAERSPVAQLAEKEPAVERGAARQEVNVPETLAQEEAEMSATPAPEKSKSSAFDLSSLENIEAEFARLLGRKPSADDK